MTRSSLSSCAFAITGLLALAAPGNAAAEQARRRGAASAEQTGQQRSEPQRADRAQAPSTAPAEQQAGHQTAARRGVPQQTPSTAPAESQQAVPRQLPRSTTQATPQIAAPRVVVPRVDQPRVETPRSNDHPAYRPDYRPGYRPQYAPNYGGVSSRPDYRFVHRPYYTFRPRFHLGFGLLVGYPVAFPSYFYPSVPYPYAYPSPDPNAYPYSAEVYPAPGTAGVDTPGGLSFDISPADASVYVDGLYVGTADQFSPDQPPLTLAPGRHHVQIDGSGFESVAFDVDILPGQVIPYQGQLRQF
jgi:hypothetical protein